MLNEDVQRRLGGHHSARILLYSIDYDAIKSRYSGGWDQIPLLLKQEAEALLDCRPDCWMLANNTLHKAYDMVAAALDSRIPFFHAVRLVRDHLVERGARRVLILGTKFTMEDGFYAAPLEAAGIRVEIPDLSDRARVQEIQSRLARGEDDESFAPAFAELLARHAAAGCEAVVTACTELPLVITQELTPMAVVDPLVLQCRACVDFALG
jgi:aspartate racemase